MRELRNQKSNPLVILIILAIIGIIFIAGTIIRIAEKDFDSLLQFVPICLVLLCISIFISQRTAGIEQKRRKLIKTGKCLDAKVINVEYDKSIKCKPLANGASWSPLIVTVMYMDESGTEHIEKSEPLYHNLSDDIKKFSSKIWISNNDKKDIYVQIFYCE